MYDLVMADATAYYEQREDELGADGHARRRATGDAAHHRPALARAPRGDGLPAGGHQPPGDGSEGPARRVAARGLRDVRQPDEGHRPGLRQVRHARPGRPQRRARADSRRTCSRPPATTVQPDRLRRGRAGRRGIGRDRSGRCRPQPRQAPPSSRRSSRTNGRRPRATRRARAAAARSSRCATAQTEHPRSDDPTHA